MSKWGAGVSVGPHGCFIVFTLCLFKDLFQTCFITLLEIIIWVWYGWITWYTYYFFSSPSLKNQDSIKMLILCKIQNWDPPKGTTADMLWRLSKVNHIKLVIIYLTVCPFYFLFFVFHHGKGREVSLLCECFLHPPLMFVFVLYHCWFVGSWAPSDPVLHLAIICLEWLFGSVTWVYHWCIFRQKIRHMQPCQLVSFFLLMVWIIVVGHLVVTFRRSSALDAPPVDHQPPTPNQGLLTSLFRSWMWIKAPEKASKYTLKVG